MMRFCLYSQCPSHTMAEVSITGVKMCAWTNSTDRAMPRMEMSVCQRFRHLIHLLIVLQQTCALYDYLFRRITIGYTVTYTNPTCIPLFIVDGSKKQESVILSDKGAETLEKEADVILYMIQTVSQTYFLSAINVLRLSRLLPISFPLEDIIFHTRMKNADLCYNKIQWKANLPNESLA